MTMNQVSDVIVGFFAEFNRWNNAFDLAPLLSEPVLGADPHGAIQVLTKDEYVTGVAEGLAQLRSIGFQSGEDGPG